MVDEYVKMCENIFVGMGIQYTSEQSAQLKRVLQSGLDQGLKTTPRSVVVIEFKVPWGTTLNYRVKADWLTIEEDYDRLGHGSPAATVRQRAGRAGVCIGRRGGRSENPSACSISAPVPGATPWPWRGGGTRWMRSR